MLDVMENTLQHHELVALLNKLSDAAKNGEPLERVEQIIDDVIAYTRFHFEFEERLMTEYGYPQLAEHQEKHHQLINDALKFKAKLRNVGEHEFVDWFHHWPFAYIHAHIIHADKQIEDYIAQHQAKA
jgi:hemerythrin